MLRPAPQGFAAQARSRVVVDRCGGCGKPAHASETDDDGYHPECRPGIDATQLQPIPTLTGDDVHIMGMVAANAALTRPRSVWFYAKEHPGAHAVLLAFAASHKGFETEFSEHTGGLYLRRSDTFTIATVYRSESK